MNTKTMGRFVRFLKALTTIILSLQLVMIPSFSYSRAGDSANQIMQADSSQEKSWGLNLPRDSNIDEVATPPQKKNLAEILATVGLHVPGQEILQIDMKTGTEINRWSLDQEDLNKPEIQISMVTQLDFEVVNQETETGIEGQLHIGWEQNGFLYKLIVPRFKEILWEPIMTPEAGMFITFVDKEYIYVIPQQEEDMFFQGPIAAFPLFKIPEDVDEIVDVQYLNLDGPDQRHLLSHLNEKEAIFTGDLAISYRRTGESEVRNVKFNRNELATSLWIQMFVFSGFVDVLGLGKEPKDTAQSRYVMDDFVQGMSQFVRIYGQLMEKRLTSQGISNNVFEQALTTLAANGGREFLEKAARKQAPLPDDLRLKIQRSLGVDQVGPKQVQKFIDQSLSVRDAERHNKHNILNAIEAMNRKVPSEIESHGLATRQGATVIEARRQWTFSQTMGDTPNYDPIASLIQSEVAAVARQRSIYTRLKKAIRVLTSPSGLRKFSASLHQAAQNRYFQLAVLGGAAYLGTKTLTDFDVDSAILGTWTRIHQILTDSTVFNFAADRMGVIASQIASSGVQWASIDSPEMITKWALAGGLILALLPVGYMAASLVRVKDLKARNLSRIRYVLSLGLRTMAKLNVLAPQTITFERLLKQNYLYRLLAIGVDPLAPRPGAKGLQRIIPQGLSTPPWIGQLPFASQEAVNQSIKKQGSDLSHNVNLARKTIPFAEYLTALLVWQLTQKDGRNAPIDAATLMVGDQISQSLQNFAQSGLAGKASLTAQILEDPAARRLWEEAAPYVTLSMVRYAQSLDPEMVQNLDETAFNYYLNRLKKVEGMIRRASNQSLTWRLKKRWHKMDHLARHKVIPGLVLGSRWRDFTRRWRYAVASEELADLTKNSGPPDYFTSVLIAMGLFPQSHVDALHLFTDPGRLAGDPGRLADAAVPPAMAFEQVLFQATNVPMGASATLVEALQHEVALASSLAVLFDLPPGKVLWNRKAATDYEEKIRKALAHVRDLLPENTEIILPRQRIQTVAEAFHALKSQFDLKKYSLNAANYLERITADSTISYLWLGAIGVGTGFTAAAWGATPEQSHNIMWVAESFAYGMWSNLNIILLKYTFLGYAVLWPITHTMHGDISKMVKKAKNTKLAAYTCMLFGNKFNNLKWTQKGVRILKNLYEDAGKVLPEKFQVDPSKFDKKLAQELSAYSFSDLSHATVENVFVNRIILSTMFLALGTTVLYFALYSGVFKAVNIFVNEGSEATRQALLETSWFSLKAYLSSWVGTKYVIPGMVDVYRSIKAKINQEKPGPTDKDDSSGSSKSLLSHIKPKKMTSLVSQGANTVIQTAKDELRIIREIPNAAKNLLKKQQKSIYQTCLGALGGIR